MLDSSHRIALLQHGGLGTIEGKTGKSMLRYSEASIVAVIDRETAGTGETLSTLTGIEHEAPIVSSVQEALSTQPDVLLIGMAPSGGQLPEDWWKDIKEALSAGLSLVNGLHTRMADDPALSALLQEGCWIWDVRGEPAGLGVGRARAQELPCRRVVMVGMDMAVGKMSAGIELHRGFLARGLRSAFLATGQTGLMLGFPGISLDAIRLDFAAGAVEQMCLQYGQGQDVVIVEGQGSLFNPASTAPLPLLRGAQPTHLVLVARPGQRQVSRFEHISLPELPEAIALYEALASACGSFVSAKVAGVALNTHHLDADAAREAVHRAGQETRLPCADVVRSGAEVLVDAITYG